MFQNSMCLNKKFILYLNNGTSFFFFYLFKSSFKGRSLSSIYKNCVFVKFFIFVLICHLTTKATNKLRKSIIIPLKNLQIFSEIWMEGWALLPVVIAGILPTQDWDLGPQGYVRNERFQILMLMVTKFFTF